MFTSDLVFVTSELTLDTGEHSITGWGASPSEEDDEEEYVEDRDNAGILSDRVSSLSKLARKLWTGDILSPPINRLPPTYIAPVGSPEVNFAVSISLMNASNFLRDSGSINVS